MKTVIITGAAHGVGKAIAKTLKHENLILLDYDEKNLEMVADALDATAYVCDVSNVEDLEKTLKAIFKKFETIDCLINNAGLWIEGHMSEVENTDLKAMNDLERIKKVIDTNLYGPIAMIRSITPYMINQGYGQIINVNSQSGVKTEASIPIYNASKTGGTAFRKAVQEDLAAAQIRITDVCPGLIDTDFYLHANKDLPQEVRDLGLSAQEVADVVKYVYDQPQHITIPSIEIMTTKTVS